MSVAEAACSLIRMATSGEGSRGGQIVGHTRSGKPIYASHLNSTGRMAHSGAIAGTAAAGPGRAAVFRVTHGSDGQPVGAKGKSAYAKRMDAIVSGDHPNAVGTRARGSGATRPAVLNKPGYRG